MPNYEYKVVPAPKTGLKAKGLKTSDARFANALMVEMNDLGAEGWEYQRTDTLPCEERSGLRGRSTTFLNMLVFRREIQAVADVVETHVEEATAPVGAESIAQTHAPLLNGTMDNSRGTAPALGPATDAVAVKDPRVDVAAQ